MRITKRIEEYIRQQVEQKAYDSPQFKALEQAAGEARQRYYAGLEAIEETAKAAFHQLLRELNVPDPEDHSFRHSAGYNTENIIPEVTALVAARSELRAKVRSTVDEILVSMEMGGDKETLNQLLDAVHFE